MFKKMFSDDKRLVNTIHNKSSVQIQQEKHKIQWYQFCVYIGVKYIVLAAIFVFIIIAVYHIWSIIDKTADTNYYLEICKFDKKYCVNLIKNGGLPPIHYYLPNDVLKYYIIASGCAIGGLFLALRSILCHKFDYIEVVTIKDKKESSQENKIAEDMKTEKEIGDGE